MNKQKSRQIDG
ncbi:hypothetical protein BIW11_04860 [Tropilaelaps mercedesae]|uniref:Uncharacterized protein n=1 Tax=Tropilaelaps mercedesae TaxID=418985 RepID=A0A1V9X0U7_9ACAR|nr:hypothetical protein BIW11_04860 [Tropilaelaps mercedesae]